MMKKSLTLKIFTIIASFLFAGSVISHKTNIKTNATEIVESTFLDVNKYNNNSYDESSKLYITMLHFDKAFASEDKSTINIANSSEELGNKMTLNGIAVKDVSNFFAAYYDAGSSGSMILLKMSEANLFPSNNYNVTTIKLPKGTHIYDAYVKDDVTIRLLNNEWAPSFGSDVSFLPNGIEGITAYGLRTGYELVSPSSLNYQEGTGSVLKIKETSPDLGASGATLDFSYRGIDVSSISEITFKVRFDFNGDISGSELRLSNNGTSSFLLRYYISNCVSGNWYSITLKSNQTAISDIPNGSAVETPRSMAKFGITLGQFEVGVRVKGTSITTYLADVQIDYVQKTSSSFIRVNSFNNNVYNKDDKVYSTMLEFDTPFASENKSHINIATKDYDLGNKMTLNGVAVKDIPGFYAAYYDAGKDGYMDTLIESSIEFEGDHIKATPLDESLKQFVIPLDAPVSMNMFAFSVDILKHLEERFVRFLDDKNNDLLKGEYFIPSVVSMLDIVRKLSKYIS